MVVRPALLLIIEALASGPGESRTSLTRRRQFSPIPTFHTSQSSLSLLLFLESLQRHLSGRPEVLLVSLDHGADLVGQEVETRAAALAMLITQLTPVWMMAVAFLMRGILDAWHP